MATFQATERDERIITVDEAQQQILAAVHSLPAEEVPLVEALGRVLREDVRAPHDLPEGDNSAMDGYAAIAADLRPGVVLPVIADLPAGSVPRDEVRRGTAARIMTGALVPPGADCVIPVEATDAGRQSVTIHAAVAAGANIRRRGEDMRAGSVVLPAGGVIGAGEIGVLAGAQRTSVTVSRRPVVAILSTGDELVDIGVPRTPGKVVNSNAYALAALVADSGAIARPCGIVPDRRDATIAAIEAALTSDVVISSGGVSVGAYDFVKDALDQLGGRTRFWRVAMKPGKPVVFTEVRERLYFGLPGNPVSCLVGFLLFVRPALRAAMGQSGSVLLPTVTVRTTRALKSAGDRRTYFRVRLVAEGGGLVAHPMRAQGSGVSSSMVGANALAYLDVGVTRAEEGDAVPAVVFAPIA